MKKIMFNDRYCLTDAVLSGGKTQTRRIIKFGELDAKYAYEKNFPIDGRAAAALINDYSKYKVGEVVAVAQSYKDVDDFYRTAHIRRYSVHGMTVSPYDCVSRKEIHDWFFRLRKELKDSAAWTNKMFVRADLMPHRIRITGVRVERLQDISDGDCIKEGLKWGHTARMFYVGYNQQTGSRTWLGSTNREAYATLLDKISGKGTWESNPYVFVYDFELV